MQPDTVYLVGFDADLPLRFSQIDRLPFDRAEPPGRPRVSPMPRPYESIEDVRSRGFGRRLTVPGIETSNIESDVRPRLISKFSNG
jgi:hypothetical protein